ncbi:Reverse transcriptase domain-containing protein [Aphis craccivora]|uniref:Reverse transcriptase domain-containing protein n=1 Tax=Aphis craccivora TaxID=307492 RepID=A0A6G0VZQ9_APHCR|nr:Reverse transcriptase domain-containing protein [Aphis craccivora]
MHIIGPLLFIIFINYLLPIKTNINIELFSFAENTAILISDPTIKTIKIKK